MQRTAPDYLTVKRLWTDTASYLRGKTLVGLCLLLRQQERFTRPPSVWDTSYMMTRTGREAMPYAAPGGQFFTVQAYTFGCFAPKKPDRSLRPPLTNGQSRTYNPESLIRFVLKNIYNMVNYII